MAPLSQETAEKVLANLSLAENLTIFRRHHFALLRPKHETFIDRYVLISTKRRYSALLKLCKPTTSFSRAPSLGKLRQNEPFGTLPRLFNL
jgi:hypothetical protein